MAVVAVVLPRMLVPIAGGASRIEVSCADPATLRDVVTALSSTHLALARRLVDEMGELRRHVNIYVDGEECRRLAGLATTVSEGARVEVIGSIAGG
ncbi:MAG: MoaD/ThiS family protein [Candidatus Nanopelagicales bacterium]